MRGASTTQRVPRGNLYSAVIPGLTRNPGALPRALDSGFCQNDNVRDCFALLAMTNKKNMEEKKQIKKAIIPVAGLGTRFLPLSKVLSKEFFPLADKPAIQYIVQEIKDSGIEEIIFIIGPNQKAIIDYFKKAPELEKILVKRKKEAILK